MSNVKIVRGEVFEDSRGRISSLNDFRFDGVGRVYFIRNADTSVLRGWHGHKLEQKWFYCVKGRFTIGLVEIDNWENPSRELKPEIHHLSDSESRIVNAPAGFASCIRAEEADSVLMVLSGKTFQEAQAVPDSYRFNQNYWSLNE